MYKKIISGIIALTMTAGAGALAASALKMGDVKEDGKIDIGDAVAIVNHVNGVKALEGLYAKAADVNGDGKIDIQDAVTVVNHVNGIKPIDDSEVAADVCKITFEATGDSIILKKGDTIPKKYGRGSDPHDYVTYDPESWFMKIYDTVYTDERTGDVFISRLTDIVCEGVSLQTMIDNGTPVEGDMVFEARYSDLSMNYSGIRTQMVFDEILDNNYTISLKADAYALFIPAKLEGEVRQMDADNSNIKANVSLSPNPFDIYTIGGKTYYVRNAEKKQYSESPNLFESMLNIQKIFNSLASDTENLKFIDERKDEKTGWRVETFETVLVLGDDDASITYNVTFDAYFDNKGDFKKLTVMDENFDPNHVADSELYLDTTELTFEPEFEGVIEAPDFSTWTAVK